MKTRIRKNIAIVLVLFLLTTLFAVQYVHAAPETKQRVYDEAGLLTANEVSSLEELAKKHSDKHKTDFIILTTDDLQGKTPKRYMQDKYDEMGFGYDKKHGNTAIITIGLDLERDKRDVYIAGFYKAEKRLSNNRVELVLDRIVPYLSDDDYATAFDRFIKVSSGYMKYVSWVNPESSLLKSGTQFIIALIVAGGVLFAMIYNSGGKITATARTYQDMNNTRVRQRKDRYIRTTVTKTRKPQNNSSGGGGGGGGRTGGGHSHSGGGRSF